MNQLTSQLAAHVSQQPQYIAALYLRWVLGIDPTDSTLRTSDPTTIYGLIKWVESQGAAVPKTLPSFNPFIDEIRSGCGIGLLTALDRYRNNVLDDHNTPNHIINTLPGIWEDMQLAMGVIGF